MNIRKLAVCCMVLGAVGCAPSDGPKTGQVVSQARQSDTPILPLSDQVVRALGSPRASGGLASLGAGTYVPGIIKPGDTITVTAFGTGESGLFNAAESAALPLGDFTVSQSGSVTLPFVGGIRVGGQSVSTAERTITENLRQSAVDPYTTVSIARKETDTYSVQGAVGAAGMFNLTARGETVLDGIATAGGATEAPDASVVTVLRGGRRGQDVMERVISDPARNIPLLPGDTVIVGGGDAQFTADGALGATGDFDFAEGSLSLAQAVARAGGLQDSRANPRAVFLFRHLDPGDSFILLETEGTRRTVTGDVIFRVDYADPAARLRAGRFQVQDGDAIYVGNAPLANFQKYFQIFSRPPEIPAPPQP
ncbi:polysaccharide export protein [Mesobaculum littorinae]|uniref:Polysaccharide export protein n=1 Tax=Mesobaculum littorinae TaxID=2486419 RepID=A0A438AHV6_9RHOB|nr:polysaccharide biosynthesis/export family protein [Mesobaculum littorinae]RVV98296.1 polysaccharide export protein [Mesobaculum littorinae]